MQPNWWIEFSEAKHYRDREQTVANTYTILAEQKEWQDCDGKLQLKLR